MTDPDFVHNFRKSMGLIKQYYLLPNGINKILFLYIYCSIKNIMLSNMSFKTIGLYLNVTLLYHGQFFSLKSLVGINISVFKYKKTSLSLLSFKTCFSTSLLCRSSKCYKCLHLQYIYQRHYQEHYRNIIQHGISIRINIIQETDALNIQTTTHMIKVFIANLLLTALCISL